MKKIIIFLFLLLLIGCSSKTTNLTYDQVINSKDKYVGQKVVWQGKVATELSQIDGIKFWIIDNEHSERSAWFWAYDETEVLPEQADGRWVSYLMQKYTSSSNYGYEKDVFEIKGIIEKLDCSYTENICVPNIKILGIEKK